MMTAILTALCTLIITITTLILCWCYMYLVNLTREIERFLRHNSESETDLIKFVKSFCSYDRLNDVEAFCLPREVLFQKKVLGNIEAITLYPPVFSGKPMIVFSLEFINGLGRTGQIFVALHEIYHAKRFYSIYRMRQMFRLSGRNLHEELAADSFAASFLGKTAGIAALEEKSELDKFSMNGKQETSHRIMALQMPTLFRQYA